MKKTAGDNFLQAVEFPKLLEKLGRDCQTPAGRDTLGAFGPEMDLGLIEVRLSKTRELESHILKAGAPVIPDSRFFIEPFEGARERGEAFTGEELAALLLFLSGVAALRRYLSPAQGISFVFQGWLGRLSALPALAQSLRMKVSEKGEILDSASSGLQSARGRLRALRSEVQNFYQSFLSNQNTAEALQEKIVTEREGRLVVPVKRDHQSQVPGFVHGLSASGSTLFVEPREIVESNNRVKEALLQEDEEVRKVLREATQEILKEAALLEETLVAAAEVDAHGALALFASRFDGQFIVPKPGALLRLKNSRHPLLALEEGKAFREKVIPLDAAFEGEVKVILVSGPNAGGKTVGLKTLGLACVMANSGIPVLAAADSSFPVLQHFDTDLSDGQSLEEHLSTYAAKLKALKRMMEGAGPGSLFLLDELGAGTDPREGGALGLACLETFREKGAYVLANTHQPLLKLLTQESSGMANAAMLFDEKTGHPTFRLVPGIPGQSYALTLARQMGFAREILEKAQAHLPQGEVDLSEVLAKLGQEKEAASKARAEAEKARDSAKKLEAELLTARRQMKDEAKRIKREAQLEAEGLLRNTRRKMEHLIQGVEAPKGGILDKQRISTARQEVNRKIQNIQPAPVKTIVEVGDLKEGDSVYFKPGECDVRILSADEEKQEAVIQMENGLKLSCKYADLGKASKNQKPAPARRPGTGVMSQKSLDEKGRLELDLRGKMVDQALPLVDKFLDDALLVDLPFVRIIHGKGTGALQQAIHQHLPVSHPGLEFAFAEAAQGGSGVTVVKFKR